MSEHEERLDDLFCKAFETNHPAMHDYALLKFDIKALRTQLEAYKVALSKALPEIEELVLDAQEDAALCAQEGGVFNPSRLKELMKLESLIKEALRKGVE